LKLPSKHVTEERLEGRLEVTRRRGRRGTQLLDDQNEIEMILEIERRSTRSHCVENWLWKRWRTCRKRSCGV